MDLSFSGITSNYLTSPLLGVSSPWPAGAFTLSPENPYLLTPTQTQASTLTSQIATLQNTISQLTQSSLTQGNNNGSNIFNAQTANLSNDSYLTASTSSSATPGNYNINVLQLATATSATSLSSIGQWIQGGSSVSAIESGTVTTGNFTVTINNQAQSIAVNAGDTVQNVLDSVASAINSVTGQAASGTVNANGQIQFSFANGTKIQFGANGDTSNFDQITNLNSGTSSATQFTASSGASTINLNGALIGNGAGLQNNTIQAGTFTLGGDSFTINSNTTLQGLMNQINGDSHAGVTMSYDAATNKLNAVSNNTGQEAILFSDNGTGFFQSVGLVNGTDTKSSQTLGQNAEIQINGGNTLQSASNTLTQSATGLTGVTLNLLAPTPGSVPVNLTVASDTSSLTSTVTNFVNQYNQLQQSLQSEAAVSGFLQGGDAFRVLGKNLQAEINAGLNPQSGGLSLSQIGISSSNSRSGTGSLTLNANQLASAIQNNPTGVASLLIGDGKTNFGVLGKMDITLSNVMSPTQGLFANIPIPNTSQSTSTTDPTNDQLTFQENQSRNQYSVINNLFNQYLQQQSSLSTLLGPHSSK